MSLLFFSMFVFVFVKVCNPNPYDAYQKMKNKRRFKKDFESKTWKKPQLLNNIMAKFAAFYHRLPNLGGSIFSNGWLNVLGAEQARLQERVSWEQSSGSFCKRRSRNDFHISISYFMFDLRTPSHCQAVIVDAHLENVKNDVDELMFDWKPAKIQ